MSTHLPNSQPSPMRKDYKLEKRKYVIGGFLIAVAVIFGIKLFTLQIADSKYKKSADTNAFLRKTVYPSRGLMYDRNGELVVFNQPAYDVMLIKRDMREFDTIDFCNTLKITKEQFDKRFHDMLNSTAPVSGAGPRQAHVPPPHGLSHQYPDRTTAASHHVRDAAKCRAYVRHRPTYNPRTFLTA